MVAEIMDEDEESSRRIDCPVLVTERLVLRPPHDEDVDAIADLADNIRVAEMLSRMPHPYTRAHAVDFVNRAKTGEIGKCVYAITMAENGVFMGCCGIHSHKHGEGLEIGYWLGEPFWGRGYATEAAHALIDLAFRATDIERLHVSCRVTNAASRRVIHKSGFQYAGTGMMDSLAAGNVPTERYTLDRRTWIGLRSWHK
ncbi:GNAT family N-acetyltransferase [Phyllobacterium phragmitis]|uniref:GNAT family N-acetyltransferase n=1 Tax=Phyllobacterium phragmitis TaxID=2670329 RepID=A0A2S9ITH6_9HYPH|nr:GNAT family protein [Phyllobacterium phragmitis]PRD43818.1 GNAT family N-acetyltransferase [Phyllobacterium phragmitis]